MLICRRPLPPAVCDFQIPLLAFAARVLAALAALFGLIGVSGALGVHDKTTGRGRPGSGLACSGRTEYVASGCRCADDP